MNNAAFFSGGKYINLPFYKRRVSLNVNDKSIAKSALKLYNPFSNKAKLLKNVCAKVLFSSKVLRNLFSKNHPQGDFIKFLKNELNKEFISSLYYPTIPDKLVLQLVSKNGSVFGYVKIGLNEYGNHKVDIERNAIVKLSKAQLVDRDYLICSNTYKNNEFIILKEIEGVSNQMITDYELLNVTMQLRQNTCLILKQHPGFLDLMKRSKEMDIGFIYSELLKISELSKKKYAVVYEHGDFAPWNIFKDEENNIKLFDFEYFSSQGIEHLDIFNYYYQTGKLLDNLKLNDLVRFLRNKIKLKEFDLMFQVFLINKILNKKRENSSYNDEMRMLKLIIVNK